jgi:hypothetical protein
VKVRRDDDDWLWHASDHVERRVPCGFRASGSFPRAEDERSDVGILRGSHDLLDRGAPGLAEHDAGGMGQLRGTAGDALLGDVQGDNGRIEQAGQVDGGAEHGLRGRIGVERGEQGGHGILAGLIGLSGNA